MMSSGRINRDNFAGEFFLFPSSNLDSLDTDTKTMIHSIQQSSRVDWQGEERRPKSSTYFFVLRLR